MKRKTIPLNIVILPAMKPDTRNRHLKISKYPVYQIPVATCYQGWFLRPGGGTAESRVNY